MNTLATFRHTKAADEPSNKRQKTEAGTESHLHKSPFFPPTPSEKIPSSVYAASQDDPHDIQSISSIGKSSTVAATVQEFRSTNTKGPSGSRTRVRKSRQMIKEDPMTTELKSPTSRSTNSESPDVLSINEIPPANVKSDLLGSQNNGKRSRPTAVTEPPIKRPRVTVPYEPIDISEDELQAHPRSTDSNTKKKTNFTPVDERRLERITNKGDIKSTEFRSPNSPDIKLLKDHPRIQLRSAISRGFTWKAKENQVHKFLSYTSGSQRALKFHPGDGEGEVRWLQLKFDKLIQVKHASSVSRFVIVSRSACPDQPPKLYLEFEDTLSCARFIGLIPPEKISEADDPTIPEKAFNHAQKVANDWKPSDNVVSIVKASPRERQQLVVEIATGSPGRRYIEEMKPTKREKLTDRLERSAREAIGAANGINSFGIENTSPTETFSPSQRTTRRTTRQSSPILPLEIFDRWSASNPSWRQRWTKSLVYPPTGKNRATVDANDIPRLDEGEFLNDNIITFYLRHLQIKLEAESPSMLKKVHIFSSFFFETLKSAKKYEGVRSWTAKIDLFSYDYIVVPVNEHAHWYLAIICNPAMTLPIDKRRRVDESKTAGEVGEDSNSTSPQMPSVERGVESISLEDIAPLITATEPIDELTDLSEPAPAAAKKKSRRSTSGISQKLDPAEPRIITLDSLGKAHSPTCRILKDYLGEEAKDKKGVELTISPPGMTGKGIPEQDNFCDCGVFVLGYMEAFLRDPDETYRRLLHKEHVDWNINPSKLRNQIRDLLFTLQEEQQEQLRQEREVKRAAWVGKKASQSSAQPSRPTVERASSQGPMIRQPTSETSKLVSSPRISPPLLRNDSPIRQQIASSPAKIQQPVTSGFESTRPRLVRPLPESSSDVPAESTERQSLSASPTKIKYSELSGHVNQAPPHKLVSPLADSSETPIKGQHQPTVSPVTASYKTERFEQRPNPFEAEERTQAEVPVQLSVEASDGEKIETSSPERHRRKKRRRRKKHHEHDSSCPGLVESLAEHKAPELPQYDGINRSGSPM